MKSIYKYQIPMSGMQFTAPFVKILNIQYQNGIPTMWAIIDTDKEDITFRINVVGTGWEFNRVPGEYVATLQDDNGYVWHFFADAACNEGASIGEIIHSLFASQSALMS